MKIFLISIVIPSYNVESYIGRCLTSILSQTYRNIQVIVIDDLSKDKTCDVVEKIAREDDRVILHKSETNGGPAVSRQIGIDISSGELLTFVDADDCYNSNFVLERVVNEFSESDVDCVMFGYRTIHAKIILKKKISSRIGLYTAQEAFIDKVKYHTIHWHYLWNKVYKSEVVKNNIRFQPNLKRAEDIRFNVDFMKVAKSFMVIPDLYYELHSTCKCN
ncbi:MAG: glycosyltransferase family A protein [Rikenellaceae bacterium]